MRASELLVAACALLALGAAVWGSHAVNGGFYWADDWYHARLYLFPDFTGLLGNRNPHTSTFRPVLGLLMAAPYQVFGLRTELHLGLAIVLTVAASVAFFWLLRTLGVERRHALVMAALPVLFPWSDSSRLWTTASINNMALVFYFVGLVVALHGLRAGGARAWALGAASLGLYVLGVLTYEVVGAAALASVVAYVWWAGWRRGLSRWAVDLVGVGLALLYVWLHQPDHHTNHPTLGQQARHALDIAAGAVGLLWSALVPADVPAPAVAAGVIGVLVAALVAARRLDRSDPARRAVRRWLVIAAAAVVGIGVSYAAFVPGLPKYVPQAPGILNRVNLLAAFGFAVLVYALLMLAGTVAARAVRRGQGTATVLTLIAVVAIAAGYVARDVEDKRHWARGWELERLTLDTTARLVPRPAPRTVIYVFGVPNYVAPGVPAFALAGDLRNAIRVRYRRPRVTAYPMRARTRWVCGARRMHPRDHYFGPDQGTPYERAFFIDVPGRRAVAIADAGQCRRWSRAFGHPPVD